MKKPCIIVDIDNTLIDTAQRKQKILKQNFSRDIDLGKIRDDFDLKLVFEKDESERQSFFNQLDSANGIKSFTAPLFPLAKETIESLYKEGIDIVFLTARPEKLKKATIEELNKLGIDTALSPIYFKSNKYSSDDNKEYKSKIIKQLGEQYFIITLVGDRLEDIYAAAQNYIPSILLTSTTQPSEILSANITNQVGFQSCADWNEVVMTIRLYISGSKEVEEFRKQMIDLYSSWLGEIDSKLNVSVAIAGILCGLSATILFNLSEKKFGNYIEYIQLYWLLLIFLTALIALVFAIRGITSRATSGEESGKAIGIRIKQGFSILFGTYKNEALKGDAISEFNDFKKYDTIQKASAHRRYFYTRYNTHDPDVWWNFRFFSIRAANYSKLYGERFASFFLIVSIALFGLWVSLTIVFKNISMQKTDESIKIEATEKIDNSTKNKTTMEKLNESINIDTTKRNTDKTFTIDTAK